MKRPDPILDEIHKVREKLGRQHGFNVRRIADALRAKEGQQGHRMVSRPPKRVARKKAS